MTELKTKQRDALWRAANYLVEKGWSMVAMVVVGSHLHGTAGENSDYDYVVVYNERPEDMLWPQADRAFKGKETKVGGDTTYFSLPHFLHLLEKGSPNAWEAVSSNRVLMDSNLWHLLHDEYPNMVSYALLRGMLGHAYSAYKTSQKETDPAKSAKEFAHAFRLLSQVLQLWSRDGAKEFQWPLTNAANVRLVKFQRPGAFTAEQFQRSYDAALNVLDGLPESQLQRQWTPPLEVREAVMRFNLVLMLEYAHNTGLKMV